MVALHVFYQRWLFLSHFAVSTVHVNLKYIYSTKISYSLQKYCFHQWIILRINPLTTASKKSNTWDLSYLQYRYHMWSKHYTPFLTLWRTYPSNVRKGLNVRNHNYLWSQLLTAGTHHVCSEFSSWASSSNIQSPEQTLLLPTPSCLSTPLHHLEAESWPNTAPPTVC